MAKPKRKRTKPLSQDEIWDDSALIDSWNEALEEYKLYHSIAARGENVQDALRHAGAYDEDDMDEDVENTLPQQVKQVDAGVDDLEEGEIDGDEEDVLKPVAGKAEEKSTKSSQSLNSTTELPKSQTAVPAAGMPQAVMDGVQDESLRNLMMAWYYAGYYTGLHEGQQRANQGR